MLPNLMPRKSLLPNGGLVSFRSELVMEKQYLLADLTMNWPCKHLLLNLKEKSFLEEAEHGKEKTIDDLITIGTQKTQTFFACARTWHLSEMLKTDVLDGQRKIFLVNQYLIKSK